MEAAAETRVARPRRTVVVEPLVAIFALSSFPAYLLSQLYIMQKIEDRLTESGARWANVSLPPSSESYCNETFNKTSPSYQLQEEVQSEASYFGLISKVAMSVPSLFVTVFLGAYSDKVGRKYAILPPLVGALGGTLSYITVMYFDLSIWYLLVGSLLEGLGGSFTMLLGGCFSYVADITSPEQRRFRITVLDLSMMLSAVLGPMAAGYMVQSIGYLNVFLIALGGQVLTILYAIFLVPETLTRDPDAKFFSGDHLKRIGSLFRKKEGDESRQWKMILLFTAFTLSVIPYLTMSIDTLFQKNEPLCWDSIWIGIFSGVHIAVGAVGGGLLAWLFKFWLPDHMVALVVGVGCIARELYIAFVQNTVMMFSGSVLSALSVLYIPSIRSLLSTLVGEGEQGSVFGTVACVEVACSLVGTAIFNPIYASTLDFMTGFVYICEAAFYLAGAGFLVVYIVHTKAEYRRRYGMLIQEDDDTEAGDEAKST